MAEKIDETLDAVVGYWTATDVPDSIAQGMRAELSAHLAEAVAHGRSVADVTGPDLGRFAEQWAEVHRPHRAGMPTFEDAGVARRGRTLTSGPVTGSFLVAGGVVALGLIFGREDVSMDELEIWRWVWVAVTAVFAVGEILTAGFFLLPFAVGGAVAAILAWVGVGIGWQWGSFLVVSVVSLFFMRRFTADAEPGPAIGANRYADALGTIIEPVDPDHATGSVRIGTELWRADADEPLEAGARVRITSVSGTRMRVERLAE